MESINYVLVPADKTQDFNQGKTTWVDGKYASIDEGSAVTLFIGHTMGTTYDTDPETGATVGRQAVYAFPVRVKKPVTRAKAINAAEMAAYGLSDAEDLASFAASMARKYRENVNDIDVKGHDEFISWVKTELDKIGLTNNLNYTAKDPTLPGRQDIVTLSRMLFSTAHLPAEEAVKVKNFAPIWGEEGAEFGKEVEKGFCLRVVDKKTQVNDLFEVIQSHTLQKDWKPGEGTESLYRHIDETHAGTEDDPIPYPADGNMALELGKYYIEEGILYECIEAVQPLYTKLAYCPRYAKPIE